MCDMHSDIFDMRYEFVFTLIQVKIISLSSVTYEIWRCFVHSNNHNRRGEVQCTIWLCDMRCECALNYLWYETWDMRVHSNVYSNVLWAGSILDTIPIQVVNEGWRCAVCCGTAMRCQTLLGVPASLRFTSSKRNVIVFFTGTYWTRYYDLGHPVRLQGLRKKFQAVQQLTVWYQWSLLTHTQ